MTITAILTSLFGAFLAGSIPFGFLIGRLNGLDLRKEGSGNIGATNVWRVLGPKWGAPAFILDFLKGLLPVLIVGHLHPENSSARQLLLVGTALGSILGHNYTPWLGFKGGKGIATSAGALVALLPLSLGLILTVWILLFIPFRIVSLSSLTASVALPIGTAFFYPGQTAYLLFSLVAGLLSIWRHRSNIQRLLQGQEPSMRPKKLE